MDTILALLPFLVFLACPLMMGFCFFGMRKMGGDVPPSAKAEAGRQLPEERVAALQQQLHAIQAELTTLRGLEALEAQAPPIAAGDREALEVEVIPGAVRAT